MDRRAFLLLTAAGFALPAVSAGAQAYVPPPPASGLGASTDTAFEAWKQDYLDRAIRAGGPADVLRREFAGLTPDPRIISQDGRQAEFSKSTGDYVKGAVTEERIATGARKRTGLAHLPQIEGRYGVPAEILIAIWGMETGFGAVQGDKDVIRSLASLAFAGRRRAWAEGQLDAAIKIIATGQATRAQLHGSWAGAMGQTQFEPDAFLAYAVDGDGDGRKDLWGSPEDALASAGNLLRHYGWRRGERWDCEVILRPGFDYSLAEETAMTPAAWARIGAVRADDGGAWSGADAVAACHLILPAGAAGPAFLVFPNHFVIRQYNNSIAYALSVGRLADRIAGGAPLKTPWPYEAPLSLADRLDAQNALTKLGFYTGEVDAMIGLSTRASLRAWQKARHLPADGHLSMEVLNKLRAEAGTATAVAH
jgi:membrane-bound lytic murein transglycosylase B